MSRDLRRRPIALVALILVTMTSLGCGKAPKQQENKNTNKAPVVKLPCDHLVNEICTQCGEIAGSCQKFRKSLPTQQAHCRAARKILGATSTTARTYDGYCRMADWVATDVNRVSRPGVSAEPADCRRFSYEVCRLCGPKSGACTSLRQRRASTGASCKISVTALLRPRRHALCKIAAGWKALTITPPKPKLEPKTKPQPKPKTK